MSTKDDPIRAVQARRARPVIAYRRRSGGWAEGALSREHVETEPGSGFFLCGFGLPPDAEVYRGVDAIEAVDPHLAACQVCADLAEGRPEEEAAA